jgi:hypothetical protein
LEKVELKTITMFKKVIIAGLMGGLTLMIWMFLINGVFGFRNRIDMKRVTNERQVYELLKQNIVEPGRYLCNPEPTPSGAFPDNEPVFSILYGGMGHEAAGVQSILEIILAIIASSIGAWLLTLTSEKIISSYPRKVLFFTTIGLLMAIFNDLNDYGIGSYPLNDALILAFHNIIIWTLIGMIIAWWIKPETSSLLKE